MRLLCHSTPDVETGGGVPVGGFWLSPAVLDIFTVGRRQQDVPSLLSLDLGASVFIAWDKSPCPMKWKQ